jgi:cellulose synthase/poly-beta-1,6-N-acetylglucosamine synthase-like glycosyltransferase
LPAPEIAAWTVIVLALAMAMLSLRGDEERARYAAERLNDRLPDELCPPATVIVAVKGADDYLAENLQSLAVLDYPDYELIVVARAREDLPKGVAPPKARVIFAGPGDPATGEKINNLLAAIREARPESQVYAFADSDSQASPGWLRFLVALLGEPGVGLASGFRWHTPNPAGFWSILRSVWNSVVAGGYRGAGPWPGAGSQPAPSRRPKGNQFAWGGATAITKKNFERCQVAKHWKGALSTDYTISRAIHEAGLTIAWAPGATCADRTSTDAAEFFNFIRRQLQLTRIYRPRLWWIGFIAHIIYCAAMIAAAIYAPPLLVVQLVLGMIKGKNRAAVAQACLREQRAFFRRWSWVYSWLTPLATWIWLVNFLISTNNVISWRGIRYRVSEQGRRVERPT